MYSAVRKALNSTTGSVILPMTVFRAACPCAFKRPLRRQKKPMAMAASTGSTIYVICKNNMVSLPARAQSPPGIYKAARQRAARPLRALHEKTSRRGAAARR